MITATQMLYLYVETPLHAGVGSGLSSIDLPIQRERTTQYPTIQGSGIKGKLRALAEDVVSPNDVEVIFGPNNGNEHAGALTVGDARILLFPVRSLDGVFAYTTSRDVLKRFERDIARGEEGSHLLWQLPQEPSRETALITSPSEVAVAGKVVLEDFSFDTHDDSEVNKLAEWIAKNAFPPYNMYDYWREKVKKSLIVLPDNDFRDFALNATEIITRVKINREKKTVQDGALWTEEHLPTDTLLYVPLYATNSRKQGQPLEAKTILEQTENIGRQRAGYIQLGGDETVGRGMVRMSWGR